ncbi:Aste57867_2988 [Aphanomyces stellatus]|uniref:Aste57867_2988 protein n=1 Tax=Aphanomyces stellatus TaxID=120398 RepID=A0A485K8S5_9STRA|nr:hypothetical protein As57867_002979 [Aphanomyces stellatus]VFT80170.1 Aste57867_2988 [Aphanomyces stellatus]
MGDKFFVQAIRAACPHDRHIETPFTFPLSQDETPLMDAVSPSPSPVHRPSNFSYSQLETPSVSVTRGSFVRDIPTVPVDDDRDVFLRRKYNGRIKTWPGLLLLVLVVGGAVAAMAYYGQQNKETSDTRIINALQREKARKSIESGFEASSSSDNSIDGLLDQIRGPKEYPPTKCQLPSYESRDGQIWAVADNGTAIPISIKGINWSGMETEDMAPAGLWDDDSKAFGTTITAITTFLANHKFNSVRLPLSVWNILQNKPLKKAIVNRNTNRAMDVSSYMAIIQSVTKALAFRGISVMISMHTLTPSETTGSWFSSTTSQEQFLTSIDMLTKALCTDDYWNILGIDLKNEPFQSTWGTGGPNDWKAGAETIAARMLQGCPKWLAFVEGVWYQGGHEITFEGKPLAYADWFGGALQMAKQFPAKLSLPHKLVYAPHYYPPSVYPQEYYFDDVVSGPNGAFVQYTELSDARLQARIDATMYDMFGFLRDDTKGPAVLLGEFGGLYTKDAHPLKTTQRCTKFTIQTMLKNGYAGGYIWTINPESKYDFNPSSTKMEVREGLLLDDWRAANEPFLQALEAMDKLPNLQPMPCFPIVGKPKTD